MISDYNLDLYRWVIGKYDLNEGIIRYLAEQENIAFYDFFECSLYLPQMKSIDPGMANGVMELLNCKKEKEWDITYELYPKELQLKILQRNWLMYLK